MNALVVPAPWSAVFGKKESTGSVSIAGRKCQIWLQWLLPRNRKNHSLARAAFPLDEKWLYSQDRLSVRGASHFCRNIFSRGQGDKEMGDKGKGSPLVSLSPPPLVLMIGMYICRFGMLPSVRVGIPSEQSREPDSVGVATDIKFGWIPTLKGEGSRGQGREKIFFPCSPIMVNDPDLIWLDINLSR